MHLNQLLFLSDSKPTSSNGFFWELVIASYGQRDVVFNSLNFTTERIILIIFWLIIYHIHHSQDWALQKNGRLLIKRSEEKCPSAYEWFQYTFWLYLFMMFGCKLFIDMYLREFLSKYLVNIKIIKLKTWVIYLAYPTELVLIDLDWRT